MQHIIAETLFEFSSLGTTKYREMVPPILSLVPGELFYLRSAPGSRCMSTLHMSTLTALSAIPPMIACVLIPPPGLEFHSLFLNYL